MTAVLETKRASLYLEDHEALAKRLIAAGEQIDLLCTDAPYSKRTHSGHNKTRPGERRGIDYASWTPEDVKRFVGTWRPLTRGWLVSITDHVLWDSWQLAAEENGLYADFPPVPLSITGSRVRMQGDGPSPISYFLLVARPRELSTWGTIGRGAYYGKRERLMMTGAKPIWAMREIIEDYSRIGQVVCDPCCGSGTTIVSALLEGRLGIGSDPVPKNLLKAVNRVRYVEETLVSTRVDTKEGE